MLFVLNNLLLLAYIFLSLIILTMKTFIIIVVLIATSTIIGYSQHALNFDGSNDYVQTTFPGISGTSARTVEAWIKTTSNSVPSSGGIQHVISDWGVYASGSRFTFCLLYSNAIRLEVYGSGLSGHIAVNDGFWHHVAAVYDPIATNKISLYVDGILDTAGNISTTINTGVGNMQIGRRIDGINQFAGSIDELRVWNYAKTAAQLIATKNTEFCSPQTGLFAYYKFNHGVSAGNNTTVTTLSDYSGNSYSGVLNYFSLMGATSNWINGPSLTQGGGTSSSISITACDFYTSPSGNNWNTSGIYTDTIPNVAGCDSIITVNLSINQSTSSVIGVSACDEYISPSGKHWFITNTYTDTIPNAVGCDSVITIILTINTIDTSVVLNGINLTANASGLTYQWIDCNNGNTVISGAINQGFTPAANGSYAVIISDNNCTDTSNCYNVVGVGINNIRVDNSVVLFPNPTKSFVNINFNKSKELVVVEINDISGKTVLSKEFINISNTKLNVSTLNRGVYYVSIKTQENIQVLKLVIM